MLCDILLAH